MTNTANSNPHLSRVPAPKHAYNWAPNVRSEETPSEEQRVGLESGDETEDEEMTASESDEDLMEREREEDT